MTEMEIQLSISKILGFRDGIAEREAQVTKLRAWQDAQIVALHDSGGMSHRQIGRAIGISGARVAQIIGREREAATQSPG